MQRFASLLLLMLLPAVAVARPPDIGRVHWRSLAEGQSARARKPMLLYVGAEWCGPCRILETTVFNQPDVVAALDAFDTVYLDGDQPDAESQTERFNIHVYPSIVAIDGAGKERARWVGSAEKRDFKTFLATAMLENGPLAMLVRLEQGQTLSPGQWRVLAQIDVAGPTTLRDDDKPGHERLARFRERFQHVMAALAKPPRPIDAAVDAKLRIKGLIVDARSAKPAGAIADYRSLVADVIADPEKLIAVERELLDYSNDILAYLAPEEGAEKKSLAALLLQALDTAYTRPEASLHWKLEILANKMALLEHGSNNLHAERLRLAGEAEALYKQVTGAKERLADVAPMTSVLRGAGREFRAEAVVRETLRSSPDAYWLMSSLAYYATQRGDLEAAVTLAEQSFRGSIGRIDPVAYGPRWVQALIDRDPGRIDDISRAVEEVIHRTAGRKDRFRDWHGDRWVSMAAALGAWAAKDATARSPAIKHLAESFQEMCNQERRASAEAGRCQAAAGALTSPPPAPG